MKGPSTICKMDPWISEKCHKIKHPSKGILKIALNNDRMLSVSGNFPFYLPPMNS